MPEKSSRLFEVVCKECHRVLMTVERLRDPEVAVLVNHLRACAASEPLGETPMLGELLGHVRVMQVMGVKNLATPPK